MQSLSPSGSHQVLARKWRPRDFDSLVGQDTVVRALRHALDNQRLHHAYLLTGTRGVGKTTIARILAKHAHVAWTTGGHTDGYVPVFAIGAGAERFHGRIDNTEIPKIVARLAGYKLPAGL